MNKSILDNDLELLSSYLDSQLTSSEKRQVEERLESDSVYKEALQKLHQTRLILRSLPQRSAPRNFTLSAEMNKKKVHLPSFFQIFRFSSAVAVLGLVILLAFDFLPSLTQPMMNTKAEVAHLPAAAAPAVTSSEPPMIVTWATAQPEVMGKGGGGGGDGGQPGPITSYAIPQPSAESSALRSDLGTPSVAPLSPQSQSTLVSPPQAAVLAPKNTESEPAVNGTGPILGVPPSDERGVILSTLSAQPPTPGSEKVNVLRIPELVLGVLALLTGIIAFIAHKKQDF